MSKIRFKFIRGEEVKYISHLDMMQVFERAARRAAIPVAYSQGFNPHPQMVFGLPLSVGVTSEAEYADFEMAEEMDLKEFEVKFNNALPKGFKITDAKLRYGKANIMATISRASYNILVSSDTNDGIELLEKKTEEFLEQTKIVVKKESKSGIKEVDIKPMIHDIRFFLTGNNKEGHLESSFYCTNTFINEYAKDIACGNYIGGSDFNKLFCISVLTSAGSASNLKPDLLVSALGAGIGIEFKIFKIHRTGLYVERDGRTYDPLDFEILKVV